MKHCFGRKEIHRYWLLYPPKPDLTCLSVLSPLLSSSSLQPHAGLTLSRSQPLDLLIPPHSFVRVHVLVLILIHQLYSIAFPSSRSCRDLLALLLVEHTRYVFPLKHRFVLLHI